MPEQLGSHSRPGLFTRESVPVPLAGVSIDAEISSFCARVAVTQRYVNRESSPSRPSTSFPSTKEPPSADSRRSSTARSLSGGQEREDASGCTTMRLTGRRRVPARRGTAGRLSGEHRKPSARQGRAGQLTYVTELSCSDTGLRFTIPTTVPLGTRPPKTARRRPTGCSMLEPAERLARSLRAAAFGEARHERNDLAHRIALASDIVTMNGPDATVGLSTA